MPKLNNNTMEVMPTAGTFQYSAVTLDNLGATDYTLVTIVTDISMSVGAYKDELEKCLVEIIKSCRRSPRADNLMVRLLTFNQKGEEVHGYKLLNECNPNDYLNILDPDGMTALYDASYDAIQATEAYAQVLNDGDFDTNSIVFILTDGDDNSSTYTKIDVNKALTKVEKAEHSLVSILIGVNIDSGTDKYLKDYKDDAGFTQYINIDDANEKNLAKLAEFIQKSISSQSQSLANGTITNQQSLKI